MTARNVVAVLFARLLIGSCLNSKQKGEYMNDRILMLKATMRGNYAVATLTDPVSRKVVLLFKDKLEHVDDDDFIRHAWEVSEEQFPDALIIEE